MNENVSTLFGKIASGAKHLGRFATGQILRLYYVLKDGELSGSEKAWIYAALQKVAIQLDNWFGYEISMVDEQ